MFDPNTGQNLDLDVSLAHPWSQDIIRRLARKMVMLPQQEKKRKQKIVRRACSRRICIKMCSSCDRTFWEVGHTDREYLQHLSQQSANPEAHLNASMFIVVLEKKIFYNSAKTQCQSYP